MIRSDTMSASVTGDPSDFAVIFMPLRLVERMAAPALATRSVNGSISAIAASRSIAILGTEASLIGIIFRDNLSDNFIGIALSRRGFASPIRCGPQSVVVRACLGGSGGSRSVSNMK